MPIPARFPESKFSLCPEGLHHAVCVDVVDLGERDTGYGRKFQVRFAWQIAEVDPATGRRHDVIATYHNTLHKSANLRADLENWRGRPFTEEEAKHFDLETLLGANALLHVVHVTADNGNVYANVRSVMPLPKGTVPLVPLDYTRAQDRQTRASDVSRPTTTWPTKPTAKPPAEDFSAGDLGGTNGGTQR